MTKIREYYDLTPSQKIMYFSLKYSPKKSLMNIGTSLWFNEEMDLEILKKALLISMERIDAVNLRLTEVDKTIKQYISDEKITDIPVVDYSDKSVEWIKEDFDKSAATDMEFTNSNLFKLTIAKIPNNRIALCIVVNHLIIDAWGLTVFMKDALDVYSAIKNNEELPKEPEPFIELIKKELEYNNSKKMAEDYEYWKNVFNERPVFCAVSPKEAGNKYGKFPLDMSTKAKVYTLPKNKVDIINKYCKEKRLSPQVLFILGLYCYLAELNNKDKAVINNALGRRSNIHVKNTSGMLVNAVPLFIKCPRNLTFKEACENIAETEFGAFKHGDFPYEKVIQYIKNKYMKLALPRSTFSDVSITYQMAKIKTEKPIDFSVKYHSNGAGGINVYLTIMDIADTGSLDFIFDYHFKKLTEDDIGNAFVRMIKSIEIGINDDSITLKEIMEKIKDLDAKGYEKYILK